MDALINTLWLLCGVIPGHIHGFYITWTYFSRKRKVLKGRWPGGPKAGIYSRRVIHGDASEETVRRLWLAEQDAREGKAGSGRGFGRRGSRLSGGGGGGSVRGDRRGSRRVSRRQSAAVSRI